MRNQMNSEMNGEIKENLNQNWIRQRWSQMSLIQWTEHRWDSERKKRWKNEKNDKLSMITDNHTCVCWTWEIKEKLAASSWFKCCRWWKWDAPIHGRMTVHYIQQNSVKFHDWTELIMIARWAEWK